MKETKISFTVPSDSERLLEVICEAKNLRIRQNVMAFALFIEAVLISLIVFWK